MQTCLKISTTYTKHLEVTLWALASPRVFQDILPLCHGLNMVCVPTLVDVIGGMDPRVVRLGDTAES